MQNVQNAGASREGAGGCWGPVHHAQRAQELTPGAPGSTHVCRADWHKTLPKCDLASPVSSPYLHASRVTCLGERLLKKNPFKLSRQEGNALLSEILSILSLLWEKSLPCCLPWCNYMLLCCVNHLWCFQCNTTLLMGTHSFLK